MSATGTFFDVTTRYITEGAADTIRANAEIFASLRSGQGNVKELSLTLREQNESLYAQRRAYSAMRMTMRVYYAEVFETVRAMQALGHIGTSILQMFNSYTLGMYRIERAQRDVTEAVADAAKWQGLYAQYLRDFGVNSAYTKEAFDSLREALEKKNAAEEASARATEAMNMAYIGMALQSIGIVASLVDVAYHIKLVTEMASAGTGAVGGLAGAFTAVKVAVESVGFAAIALSLAKIAVIVLAVKWLAEQMTPPSEYGYGVGVGEWEYKSLAEAAAGEAMTPEQLTETFKQKQGEQAKETAKWIQQYGEKTGTYWMPYYGKERWGNIGLTKEEFLQLLGGLLKGEGAGGIANVPVTGLYKLHRNEQVLTPEQKRMMGQLGTSGSLGRTIQVTQYNQIHETVDFERANEQAVVAILRKLGNK